MYPGRFRCLQASSGKDDGDLHSRLIWEQGVRNAECRLGPTRLICSPVLRLVAQIAVQIGLLGPARHPIASSRRIGNVNAPGARKTQLSLTSRQAVGTSAWPEMGFEENAEFMLANSPRDLPEFGFRMESRFPLSGPNRVAPISCVASSKKTIPIARAH